MTDGKSQYGRYGLIRRADGEFQLCSALADIEGKKIVRVSPHFAKRQASLFTEYHDFQTILHDLWDGAPMPADLPSPTETGT